MWRAIVPLALLLACGVARADNAEFAGFEMDVMDVNETPAQAIERSGERSRAIIAAQQARTRPAAADPALPSAATPLDDGRPELGDSPERHPGR